MIWRGPVTFQAALEYLQAKQLLPTTLGSARLRALEGGVQRRAFFSARVTQAEILSEAQRLTETIAGQITETQSNGDERLLSIAEAKRQLLDTIQGLGYDPGADVGTIKDLTSDQRLNLIVETNVLDAQGYGRHEQAQDQDLVDVTPAWELVRMVFSRVPRDWKERWAAALDATTTEGATPPGSGRMVALKNHPVWQALGEGAGGYTDTLGNPWPPFAFNSGMNVVDVAREDAIALGLLQPGTRVPVAGGGEDGFNEGLEADTERFTPALQKALAADPQLKMANGVLTLGRAA